MSPNCCLRSTNTAKLPFFSSDIEAHPNSEVGQIATECNRNIARIWDEINAHKQTNEWRDGERLRMKSVLAHAEEGIYQLDIGCKIASAKDTPCAGERGRGQQAIRAGRLFNQQAPEPPGQRTNGGGDEFVGTSNNSWSALFKFSI